MISLKRWRLAGIVAITILGVGLHYFYSWTNNSKIAGLLAPVNESVWEHLKLGYWSLVLFSSVEYFSVKNSANNYLLAKAIGVLALELTIIIIFYGYTFLTGHHNLVIDILSYILAVITCQYLIYWIYRSQPATILKNRISLGILIFLGVLFGVLTYYPPHVSLFQDPVNKTYGILKER